MDWLNANITAGYSPRVNSECSLGEKFNTSTFWKNLSLNLNTSKINFFSQKKIR